MPSLSFSIPLEHPALPGHFPGQPIVPGVVLLDQAILLVEAAESLHIRGIAAAKFLSPVKPDETLWLDYETSDAACRFEIRAADRKIANGRLERA